jgi:ABC-type amino acid transport substrate-binding protein
MMISLILIAVGCNNCGKKGSGFPTAAESMEKNKMVRIAIHAANAPFEFGMDTGVQGYDADIVTEIAKNLGYPIQWFKMESYDEVFNAVKEGKAEFGISAIAIDPKKADTLAFSNPYYDTWDIIAIQRENFAIKSLANLSGKRVGVATGRPGDTFMTNQKTATGVQITRKKSLDDVLGSLNRGELDAVVGDETILTYSGFKSFTNTTFLQDQKLNEYQYATIVRKDEQDLLKKINAVIDRMKSSGELAQMKTKWFEKVKADAQEQLNASIKNEALKTTPKTISVVINKLSGAWNMDRLDGFVLVLEGAAGRYQSSAILTNGNKGNCTFSKPVPPGNYKLNMKPYFSPVDVPVPNYAKTTLAMEMNISTTAGIAITFK